MKATTSTSTKCRDMAHLTPEAEKCRLARPPSLSPNVWGISRLPKPYLVGVSTLSLRFLSTGWSKSLALSLCTRFQLNCTRPALPVTVGFKLPDVSEDGPFRTRQAAWLCHHPSPARFAAFKLIIHLTTPKATSAPPIIMVVTINHSGHGRQITFFGQARMITSAPVAIQSSGFDCATC